MSEEIIAKWGNLKLTEVEQLEIKANNYNEEVVIKCGKFCLVGLLIADKVVNKEAFRTTMLDLWKLKSWVHFRVVGVNLFLFEFQNDYDLMRVQRGRPWSFDRNLLCLNSFDGFLSPKDLSFNKEVLWVQLHNLPLCGMSWGIGVQVGNKIGNVMEVDVDEDDIG